MDRLLAATVQYKTLPLPLPIKSSTMQLEIIVSNIVPGVVTWLLMYI